MITVFTKFGLLVFHWMITVFTMFGLLVFDWMITVFTKFGHFGLFWGFLLHDFLYCILQLCLQCWFSLVCFYGLLIGR